MDKIQEALQHFKQFILPQERKIFNFPALEEVRCMSCNKLLGKLIGRAEIKCNRCGRYNSFKN